MKRTMGAIVVALGLVSLTLAGPAAALVDDPAIDTPAQLGDKCNGSVDYNCTCEGDESTSGECESDEDCKVFTLDDCVVGG